MNRLVTAAGGLRRFRARWLPRVLLIAAACAAGVGAVLAGGQGGGAAAAEGLEAGTERAFLGIDFVWCPPGSFKMGHGVPPARAAEATRSREEWFTDAHPSRETSIPDGFWISKYPVTRGQWESVMNALPEGLTGDDAAGPDDLPVTEVAYADAERFVERINRVGEGRFRLPTEAEWEYACRAGTETLYSFGDTHADLSEHGWHWGNTVRMDNDRLQPVGLLEPNPWGLHDVHGNVWEWCDGPYPGGARDGALAQAIRGGSYRDFAPFLTSGYRSGADPATPHPVIGFRIVRAP